MQQQNPNRPPQHCLVFDPIAFKGGSKIATREMLSQCDAVKVRFTVITRDPESWQMPAEKHDIQLFELPSAGIFNQATRGISFWIKHGLFLLYLLRLRLKTGPVDTLIGASGPGVDMALYLLKPILRCRLIQLIHGPVGCSRSIGRGLLKAQHVFYLASAKASMKQALIAALSTSASRDDNSAVTQQAEVILAEPRFQPFINGLNRSQWPTPCQYNRPTLFWCASLLKWKGLDLFLSALKHHIDAPLHFSSNICFIRPKDASLEVSKAPKFMKQVFWFHDPANLDQIRSQSNIFISTSKNEPFGLSVLEAMAAEMCVIIPRDQAYWDTVLTDQQNCLKYQPDDPASLAEVILQAIRYPALVQRLGQAAAKQAKNYQAEQCYLPVAVCIENPHTPLQAQQVTTGEKL